MLLLFFSAKIKGIIEFNAEYGNFIGATWQGSQGLWIDRNYTYVETGNTASFQNTPTKVGVGGYTGTVYVHSTESYTVGITRSFTYEQAFTP